MMFAGAGVSTIGSVLGLNARGRSAEAKAESYEVQAQQDLDQVALQQRQITLDLASGGYQANQKERQAAQFQGKQEVATAASGFTLSGSPTDAVIDSRQQAELDAQAIQYGTTLKVQNSALRAGGLMNKARSDYEAAGIERSSKPGALDYVLGIGGALTSAGSSTAGQRALTRLGGRF
jgi:hypothetical protein